MIYAFVDGHTKRVTGSSPNEREGRFRVDDGDRSRDGLGRYDDRRGANGKRIDAKCRSRTFKPRAGREDATRASLCGVFRLCHKTTTFFQVRETATFKGKVIDKHHRSMIYEYYYEPAFSSFSYVDRKEYSIKYFTLQVQLNLHFPPRSKIEP